MRILLVNDDGYEASGLLALKEILQSYGEVYVVAPSTGKSGAGCSSVKFGAVNYKTDETIHFDIVGDGIILFDALSKRNVSLGSVEIL